MASEVVVGEQLTEEMIKAGKAFLGALDIAEIPISGAFWLFSPESETWQLVLVSEKVKEMGPLKVYGDIQDVLLKRSRGRRLRLSDITVMEHDASLVVALRKEREQGLLEPGTRLRRTAVNSNYIEGAYIYRIT